MIDYRPLTRREQLEWLLKFLKEQKSQIEKEIEIAQNEYRLVLKKEGEPNDI